jgi:hypothetical protein
VLSSIHAGRPFKGSLSRGPLEETFRRPYNKRKISMNTIEESQEVICKADGNLDGSTEDKVMFRRAKMRQDDVEPNDTSLAVNAKNYPSVGVLALPSPVPPALELVTGRNSSERRHTEGKFWDYIEKIGGFSSIEPTPSSMLELSLLAVDSAFELPLSDVDDWASSFSFKWSDVDQCNH